MSHHRASWKWLLLVPALLCILSLSGGCDRYGWLTFNIIVPLGLDGDVGLLNPTGQGTIFVPVDNVDNEPPTPIQVGDPSQPGQLS